MMALENSSKNHRCLSVTSLSLNVLLINYIYENIIKYNIFDICKKAWKICEINQNFNHRKHPLSWTCKNCTGTYIKKMLGNQYLFISY